MVVYKKCIYSTYSAFYCQNEFVCSCCPAELNNPLTVTIYGPFLAWYEMPLSIYDKHLIYPDEWNDQFTLTNLYPFWPEEWNVPFTVTNCVLLFSLLSVMSHLLWQTVQPSSDPFFVPNHSPPFCSLCRWTISCIDSICTGVYFQLSCPCLWQVKDFFYCDKLQVPSMLLTLPICAICFAITGLYIPFFQIISKLIFAWQKEGLLYRTEIHTCAVMFQLPLLAHYILQFATIYLIPLLHACTYMSDAYVSFMLAPICYMPSATCLMSLLHDWTNTFNILVTCLHPHVTCLQ